MITYIVIIIITIIIIITVIIIIINIILHSYICTTYVRSMLMPSMDPIQWREEAERVVSKLKNGTSQNRLSENWVDHLTVLKNYVTDNEFMCLNNNKKINNKNIDQNDIIKNKKSIVEKSEICMTNENRSSILQGINHLKLTLSSQLEAISRNEKIINSSQKIHLLSAEYEENKKVKLNYSFAL